MPEGAPGAAVGGEPLRLGDVADVVEDHQPLIGEAVVDGGDGLILVVEKLPGVSTKEVTEGVEEALESMRAGSPVSNSTPGSTGRRPTSTRPEETSSARSSSERFSCCSAWRRSCSAGARC